MTALIANMKPFAFEPVLFAHRSEAEETLRRFGCEWSVHFSSIDLMHDIFGIEVCGVPTEITARRIESILRWTFPAWRYSYIWLPALADGPLDEGWVVVIHRDTQQHP